MTARSSKDDAQKQFARLQRAEDGRRAMSDHEADAAAVRAKTVRLRALRLARDADLAAAAPPAPAKKKTAARPAAKETTAAKDTPAAKGTLSAWLADREGSGHNN